MNYMNSNIVPGDQQTMDVNSWLQQMGIDPATFQQYMAQMGPGGMKDMRDQAMAATGWDGVNQKLQYLGAMMKQRRTNPATGNAGNIRVTDPNRVPYGSGGYPQGQGGNDAVGAMKDKSRGGDGGFFKGIGKNIFGSGTFGDIAGVLFPGIAHPGMVAPLPFSIGRKLFK